jgi:hypothetical protein
MEKVTTCVLFILSFVSLIGVVFFSEYLLIVNILSKCTNHASYFVCLFLVIIACIIILIELLKFFIRVFSLIKNE